MPANNSALQTILQLMDNPVEQQNIEVPSQKKNWSNHLLSNSLYLFSVSYITSPLLSLPLLRGFFSVLLPQLLSSNSSQTPFGNDLLDFRELLCPMKIFLKFERNFYLLLFFLYLKGGGRNQQ